VDAAVDPRQIVDEVARRADETLAQVRAIVEHETPTSDKAYVDTLIDYLQERMTERGMNVERRVQDEYGDLLVGRLAGNGNKPLLVMTHIDTVWPVGTLDSMPWRIEDGRAHGPGVYDMKVSAGMMLTALDIINALALPHRPIVWIVNTEEEVGSPVSRPVLEALARESEIVLCLEPPVPPHGGLKTERKGVGMFTMTVEGRASHAGADHQSGISALEELAHQIQWLHGFTDYERGTTVNVGVASGGTKRNVVAAHAEALIDLRVTSMAEAERVVPLILDAKPHLDGASVTVSGELNRPPMERSAGIIAAFERAKEIGASIGQELTEGSTGGGSDGNFTAALGVPTLDGLGCVGDGAHADHEHILLEHLQPRTALITMLLASL
jgi:glutamate carboxypeptidase